MHGIHGAAWYHITWDDCNIANGLTDEQETIADVTSASFWKASALLQRGAICATTGKSSEAVQILKQGMAAWRATGASIATPSHLAFLARAYAELGQFDEAWNSANHALECAKSSGELYFFGGIHQIAAEIALAQPEPDEVKAEAHLEDGLHFARERVMKGTELRLSLILARLWRDQGKTREAYELLSPVYNWFTEGFDWTDIKQAKALLEELKSALN